MPKKKAWAFNETKIKDGWVVKMNKDGTIRSKVQPWIPGGMNKDDRKTK